MRDSDLERMMIEADKQTKTSYTRWSTDWKKATLLYEQAADGFWLAKDYQNAKIAFEKASEGRIILLYSLRAAKHMESAAAAAKELNSWIEVSKFYTKASDLYKECGKLILAFKALHDGAKALEDASLDESVKMYHAAISILLEEGFPVNNTLNIFHDVAYLYFKNRRYRKAAETLIELSSVAAEVNDTLSQFEGYFGAIINYLYADDFKHGEDLKHAVEIMHTLSETESLIGQSELANELFCIYVAGDYDRMKLLLLERISIPTADTVWMFQGVDELTSSILPWGIIMIARELALKVEATKIK